MRTLRAHPPRAIRPNHSADRLLLHAYRPPAAKVTLDVAARTGNLLNLAELGREAGISGPSAKHRLSVLEASQIVKLVRPYHPNFGKRIRSWKPPSFPNGSRPAETGASSPGCT